MWELLDDDGTYYLVNEVDHALNVGQRLWALLTLCIERRVSFTLTNGQAFYQLNTQLTDFLAMLRVEFSGTKLIPDTIHQLDARQSAWRSTPGNPKRYVQLGFDLFGVTPQPASGSNSVTITYAAEPAIMVLATDTPEIAPEHQPNLTDFALYWLRLKEGGQESANTVMYLKRFISEAQKYQSFVRSRSRGQLYDTMPKDLALFDRARLEIGIIQQPSISNTLQ